MGVDRRLGADGRRRSAAGRPGVAGLADLDAAVVDELGDEQADGGGDDRQRRSPARGVSTALARVAARTAQAAAAAQQRSAEPEQAQERGRRAAAGAGRSSASQRRPRAAYDRASAQRSSALATSASLPRRAVGSARAAPSRLGLAARTVGRRGGRRRRRPASAPLRQLTAATLVPARPLLSSRVAGPASSSRAFAGPRGPFSCADPGSCRKASFSLVPASHPTLTLRPCHAASP